jgi:hypothetical protein
MIKATDMAMSRSYSEAAMDMAHRMRMYMAADLDEYDMADRVRAVNAELNADALTFGDAWQVLSTAERRAWKTLLELRKPDEHRY